MFSYDFFTLRRPEMPATEIWAEGRRVLTITDQEMESEPLEWTMSRIRVHVNIAHSFEVLRRQIWERNKWPL